MQVIATKKYLENHPRQGRSTIVKTLGDPLEVFIVKNALLIPPHSLAFKDDFILEESALYDTNIAEYLYLYKDEKGDPEKLPEVVALNVGWSTNFWHWCMEIMPKVIIAEELGFKGQYLISQENSFALEFMRLLGIPEERLIFAEDKTYQVKRLYLFPRNNGRELEKFPEIIHRIRQRIMPHFEVKEPRRIYISRQNAKKGRNIVNEFHLLKLLNQYGFETVKMEDLSLREQLAIMVNCECLVAPHGAGMTHTLFMPEGSLIIELFSPLYVLPCMLGPIDILQQNHYPITSFYTGDQPYQYGTDKNADIAAFNRVIEVTLKRELECVEGDSK